MTDNKISEELLQAKKFHGHLGPYLAVGMCMGKVFCEILGREPFSYRIFTSVGFEPPLSCVIDGLQLTSPGTIGNSMIKVEGEGVVSAWAHKDNIQVNIRLRDDKKVVIDRDTDKDNEERIAEEIWNAPLEEYFTIERLED